MIALLLMLQTLPGPSVTAIWDPNPASDNVTGYHLIVDNTIYDVGWVTTYTIPVIAPGVHVAAVTATNADGITSPPSTPPVTFTIGQPPDPCAPPLGSHAPAIFPTSPTFTGSKSVGSQAFLNYQLGGPDPVVEIAVQIDGEDVIAGKGADLGAFSGMWFTMPALGTHTLGLRVLTSFGCRLIRNTSAPLVVK